MALLVRSGDAVVLSGEARKCYHGVPRIFPLRKESENEGNGQGKKLGAGSAGPRPLPLAPEFEEIDWGEEKDEDDFNIAGSEFDAIAEFMKGCRINISIRSTAHPPESIEGAEEKEEETITSRV